MESDFSWQQRNSHITPKEWSEVSSLPPGALSKWLLENRGYFGEEVQQAFLKATLSELHSPFSLKGMDAACARLQQAFVAGQQICVYADFDLDGTSGCALLVHGLRDLGFQHVQFYQPQRLQEGYGFHSHIVEDLKAKGVDLIVTVDVGITAIKACARAREIGIDVIVTDHHQAGLQLPECVSLINPNQPGCESGLGYLSGAGVAFYLLRAVKRTLVDSGLIPENRGHLQSLLDLLTLATITDMVPIKEDNRILIRAGLKVFERTTRPGLRGLLRRLDLQDRPLTTQDIGIRLAPKLNALSRLELGIRPLDVLMMETEDEKILDQVLSHNKNRVDLQGSGEALALKMWEARSDGKATIVFLCHEEFHRGVVGLIATKMATLTGLPSFIGSLSAEGGVVGSARRPAGSVINLVDALRSAESNLVRFGGHPAAAGFEIGDVQRIPQVVESLRGHLQNSQQKESARVLFYDFSLPLQLIDTSLLHELEGLGPYGVSFENPLLHVTNAKLESVRVLKEKHLRLSLKGKSHHQIEAIWFSVPQIQQKIERLTTGKALELIAELQWSYFGGNTKLQLLIYDIQVRGDDEKEKRPKEEPTAQI